MINYADENMIPDKPEIYDYEDRSEFLDYVMQYNANQKFKKRIRREQSYEDEIVINFI